jgi:hypothetical protein
MMQENPYFTGDPGRKGRQSKGNDLACPPPLKAPSDPQREIFSAVHRQTKQAKPHKAHIKRREAIKLYIAELERSRVPPLVVDQAAAMFAILLGR